MLVLLEPERPQQRKGWRAFYIDKYQEEVKASSDISAQAQVNDSQPDKASARVNHRLCHFAWVLGHTLQASGKASQKVMQQWSFAAWCAPSPQSSYMAPAFCLHV